MTGDKNAMLSDVDREFILSDGDYYTGKHAKQQRYQRRKAIREKVRSSLKDFTLLFDHLDDGELEKIFTTDEGTWLGEEDPEFYAGARDALATILYHTGITQYMGLGSAPSGLLAADLLEEAYERAGLKDEFVVESVEPPEIDATRIRNIRRDLESDDRQLPPRAIGLLLQSGKLDGETLARVQDLVREDFLGDEE